MATQTALQRLVRRALLTSAKADAALTALVPAASIAPDGTPVWPFVLVESPRTLKIRAACVRGAAVTFDLHAFAGPRLSAGVEVETAYDHVSRIGAAIETLFDDRRITLEGGATCLLKLSDTNILKDDEPNAQHWFAQCNARVLSE